MEYPPEFRLILASKNVGNEFPYYAPAAVRMRFRKNNNIPTMCINHSLVIAYNEAFIKKLTDKELTMVVLHEILHYINDHHTRYLNCVSKDTVPFEIHNIAMDIEINEFIDNLPEGACIAKDFKFPDRKSYEEYLLLLNEKCQWRYIEDYIIFPANDLNLDGYDVTQADIHKKILDDLKKECKEHEKNIGNESGSIDVTRKIHKRKYRWEQVFQNILTTKVTEITTGFRYRTFEKTNRRYVHTPDIILPVFIDRKVKISLVIIMDVSGSMYEITDKMYSIMKSMIDILDMAINVTILEVNTDVVNIIRRFDLNRNIIESKSGGGTDMGAGLYYIQDNKMTPDLIIVMTDSRTPWSNPPILSDKTVVLTDNPDFYDGPYPMFPVIFENSNKL